LGPVSISGSTATLISAELSQMLVTVTNNKTSKSNNYVITFIDAGAIGTLDCGDTIVSIVPAA